MENSLIFQGKKYISSKRASKISGYSSDYIGQLCRAGKLNCRMVGHTWFVSKESLIVHRWNTLKESVSEDASADAESEEQKIYPVSTPVAAVTPLPAPSMSTMAPTVHLESVPFLFWRRALTIAVVAVVIGIALSASDRLFGWPLAGTERPIVSFLEQKFQAVAGLFGYGPQMSANIFAPTEQGKTATDTANPGLVLTPSSGSGKQDDLTKANIRDSFSDEVRVAADQSGTAGVVTPIFKSAKGKDFIYVMVPVNDSRKQ